MSDDGLFENSIPGTLSPHRMCGIIRRGPEAGTHASQCHRFCAGLLHLNMAEIWLDKEFSVTV